MNRRDFLTTAAAAAAAGVLVDPVVADSPCDEGPLQCLTDNTLAMRFPRGHNDELWQSAIQDAIVNKAQQWPQCLALSFTTKENHYLVMWKLPDEQEDGTDSFIYHTSECDWMAVSHNVPDQGGEGHYFCTRVLVVSGLSLPTCLGLERSAGKLLHSAIDHSADCLFQVRGLSMVLRTAQAPLLFRSSADKIYGVAVWGIERSDSALRQKICGPYPRVPSFEQ